MKYRTFVFAAVLSLHAYAQKAEYVCQPCGGVCDQKVYGSQGICATCNMPLVEKSTVNFTNLNAKEFCAWIAANPNALILDVRSTVEFAGSSTAVETFGHFKNAVNININQLANRVGELAKYKDREILVYCSHSQRSPRASYYLGLQGFKNVKNLLGGVSSVQQLTKEECFKKNFVDHSH